MPKNICPWAVGEIYIAYHDNEWGVPEYDDQKLFEFLILEGMQAGLSWITILKKREGFRKAFDNFNPNVISQYDDQKIEALMQNTDIIRNRRKIEATIKNAKAYLKMQARGQSFAQFLWAFVGNSPIVNTWEHMEDVPATTTVSELMSKTLKKEGFNFVGPTICYSLMQATGMVNDHLTYCDCHPCNRG